MTVEQPAPDSCVYAAILDSLLKGTGALRLDCHEDRRVVGCETICAFGFTVHLKPSPKEVMTLLIWMYRPA
ncbi:hypothetical protein DESC_700026 [Desulfosarcina cetonica]|nr:hypothetical protein DESC_700026 [Desulfosarcina cetonica]